MAWCPATWQPPLWYAPSDLPPLLAHREKQPRQGPPTQPGSPEGQAAAGTWLSVRWREREVITELLYLQSGRPGPPGGLAWYPFPLHSRNLRRDAVTPPAGLGSAAQGPRQPGRAYPSGPDLGTQPQGTGPVPGDPPPAGHLRDQGSSPAPGTDHAGWKRGEGLPETDAELLVGGRGEARGFPRLPRLTCIPHRGQHWAGHIAHKRGPDAEEVGVQLPASGALTV